MNTSTTENKPAEKLPPVAKGCKRVWWVLADTETPGPAADYTKIFRFWKEADARTFASKNKLYGRPATADYEDAPKRLWSRWPIY